MNEGRKTDIQDRYARTDGAIKQPPHAPPITHRDGVHVFNGDAFGWHGVSQQSPHAPRRLRVVPNRRKHKTSGGITETVTAKQKRTRRERNREAQASISGHRMLAESPRQVAVGKRCCCLAWWAPWLFGLLGGALGPEAECNLAAQGLEDAEADHGHVPGREGGSRAGGAAEARRVVGPPERSKEEQNTHTYAQPARNTRARVMRC